MEEDRITGIATTPSGARVDASTGSLVSSPINSQSLAQTPSVDFETPQQTPIFPVGSLSFEAPQQELTQPEQQVQGFSETIQQLNQRLLGQSAEQARQEEARGIPQLTQQFTDLSSRLSALQAESQAIPLQIQQESIGRGRTRGGVEPIQTARLRENAIQALSTASLLEATRGNLATAQSLADRAVAQKYDPIREQIAVAQRNLDLVKESPAFTVAEKNRALQTQLALQDRQRVIEKQAQEEKGIQEAARIALQNGAPVDVAENILNTSKSINDAYIKAGQYLRDPQAKVELENARLRNVLTRAQIDKTNTENYYLKLYGGMTPSEYAKYQKEQDEAIKNAKTEEEQNRLRAQSLGEKISLLEGITNSSGLNSAVGTNAFSRNLTGRVASGAAGAAAGFAAGSFLPGIGNIVGGVVGGITGLALGSPDQITGEQQNFIGAVEQMISQEFLDSLVEVKAAGGTFGSLDKGERDALTNAATKIGSWRIREGNEDSGKVLGYNIDQDNFVAEVNTILELARLAEQRATGKLYTAEEQQVLDDVFDTGFDPGNW